MFYPNVNNSRSFIFYFIIIFVNVILPITSYIRNPQIISGGGRYAPLCPPLDPPLTTPLSQQHNKTVI